MHPILFRLPLGDGTIPIYTWGVTLGLSLIVGWFLTLGLAQRDGLPREMLANCYVITALSALVFARLLFVITNPDGMKDPETAETSFWAIFAVRSGGMIAYGGFLGGLLGSFAYLSWKKFPLMPWADVAVPSLASGLFFTRIGCYLYGCDFGTPLPEGAPGLLQKAGTFPRWPEGTIEGGSGSLAWLRHDELHLVPPDARASLPVHPTQLYEAALGAVLLVFLLWARRRQTFRGQLFLYFTFLYGFARFVLEFWRDDEERGSVPPALAPHLLYGLSLAIFGAAFAFGIAPMLKNRTARTVATAAAFVPALWAFVRMRPGEFAAVADVQLSTSQFIGLASAGLAAWAFRVFDRSAAANPEAAMAPVVWKDEEEREDEEAGASTSTSTSTSTKKKRKKKTTGGAKPTPKAKAEEAGET